MALQINFFKKITMTLFPKSFSHHDCTFCEDKANKIVVRDHNSEDPSTLNGRKKVTYIQNITPIDDSYMNSRGPKRKNKFKSKSKQKNWKTTQRPDSSLDSRDSSTLRQDTLGTLTPKKLQNWKGTLSRRFTLDNVLPFFNSISNYQQGTISLYQFRQKLLKQRRFYFDYSAALHVFSIILTFSIAQIENGDAIRKYMTELELKNSNAIDHSHQIFLDLLDHGFAMLPEMTHRNRK